MKIRQIKMNADAARLYACRRDSELVAKRLRSVVRAYWNSSRFAKAPKPAMRSGACCEKCNDGEGNCAFPYYGAAPHTFFWKIEGASVGGSRELPQSEWPENFELDPDAGPYTGYPRGGVYTHCPHCGAPGKSTAPAGREVHEC